MDWKKVIDSKELIVMEKQQNGYKIKIEARLNENKSWDVYQTYVKGDNTNIIKEFSLRSRNEVHKIINRLTREKDPLNNKVYQKEVTAELKRVFKEELVEKWMFTVSGKQYKNFIFIKYDETIKADIVMHEKYKPVEEQIIDQLEDKLALREFSEDIVYDIFYFRSSEHKHTGNPMQEPVFSDVYIQFGYDEPEE